MHAGLHMLPYPIAGDEEARLQSLEMLGIVGTPTGPDFDAVVRLAASFFDCPISVISFLEKDRQWFKARHGLDIEETPRRYAFCNYALVENGVFVIKDTHADPRFHDNPFVQGPPYARFYAGCPLRSDSGHQLGTLCLLDTKPRSFDADKARILTEFGQVVEGLIRAHANAVKLAVSEANARCQSEALARRNRLLAQTEHLASIGGWEYDAATGEITWSDEVYRLHDLEIGSRLHIDDVVARYTPEAGAAMRRQLELTASTGSPCSFEADLVTAAGERRTVRAIGERVAGDDDGHVRVVGVVQDVTREIEATQALWRAAHLDGLTGVANRAAFKTHLEAVVDRAAAAGRPVWLLLLDLDGFKEINDTCGHHVGDRVLIAVAERLGQICSGRDMFLARLGGDEFAIVCDESSQVDGAERVAARVVAAIRKPIRIGSDRHYVTTTVGLATYPTDATTADGLLKCADVALYTAKRRERGAVGTYAPEVASLFDERRLAVETVRKALASNRLVPFYQPIVKLRNGQLSGYEALVRIRGRDGMLMSPQAFSHAFADQDSARRIGERVLNLVTSHLAELRAEGFEGPIVIGVNASAAEFAGGDFAERFLRQLRARDIPPSWIKLEVTETVLMGEQARNVRLAVEELSEAGVPIALDDFGTGYSSLTHLRDFPINCIKIDRSFVAGIGREAESPAIIRALIELAHNLGLTVIAEGVETDVQLEFLRAIGCDAAQGFRFSKAGPFDMLRSQLRKQDRPALHYPARLR
ncbi:diguanylate cyclase (GGDEF) domain [Chelatococcus sambhunathii]|uniref:Diguanylate cyclase (GGDEF) domain n=2 Tax=Chelatococcus sambhunathii TaxID=363953 RepID=A0ABM9U839_9HYPH|nr:diguanylate cyclase (GGDEF) domain [Chelatococcus sambhunathii]